MKKKELLKRIEALEKRYDTPEEIALLEGKKDKFAELKEAHKNGAVIQSKSGFGWITASNPQWYNELEYRIKPEEKPKVGDVVKAWNDYEEDFIVGVVTNIDYDSLPYEVWGNWHKHSKKLTQQEAIDLLFNK